MLVKFKKTGNIKDSKAGELFIKMGLAEKVETKDNAEKSKMPEKKKPVKKKVVKTKPAKRGRPKRKK